MSKIRDVGLCFCAAGADLAHIVESGLIRNGYTVVCGNAASDSGVNAAVVVLVCTPGLMGMDDASRENVIAMLEHAIRAEVPIVPVRANNCDWAWPADLPKEIAGVRDLEVSTLDFVGTDFELSLDKACERFPKPLRKKNDSIRQMMKRGQWASLLEKYPELSGLCRWDSLSGDDWSRLLRTRPEFADKCDWGKLSNLDWRYLLKEQPKFSENCDWTRFDGDDWEDLLSRCPQFADKCDWSKFTESYHWFGLLKNQPQFADRCDWESINRDDDTSGYRWVELIEAQPQFADKCDWTKLNSKNWSELLTSMPEFAAECVWHVLDGEGWSNLLQKQPQFADKCRWKLLDGHSWAALLAIHPQFADHCDWRKFEGIDWMDLLLSQPMFVDRCEWFKLQSVSRAIYWYDFLCHYPQFADKFDPMIVDGWACTEIIERFPSIRERIDWSRFDVSGRQEVDWILDNPSSAYRCDWTKLDDYDWDRLIAAHPEFAKHRPSSASCKHCDFTADRCVDADNDNRFDVFVCSAESGRGAARRLGAALEKRNYSVYVDEAEDFTEEDRAAIDSSVYFVLVRSVGLFAKLSAEGDPLAAQIIYAIESGKRLVMVGPMDQKWQEAVSLPEALKSIETEQVKNLDMGDLFEEKVDAIVRETLRNVQGALARKYDIFISYRRKTGAEFARRVHQSLKSLGCVAFLDYDSILNGKYDRVICSALDSAKVFLMLLTDESLERCADEGDWVATEIRMARKAGKCIIPITPDNQHWTLPDNLPSDLSWIAWEHITRIAMSPDGFDSSISELKASFPVELQKKSDEIVATINKPKNIGGDSRSWAELLEKYPEAIAVLPWRDFSGGDWCEILQKVPELAPKCDWSQFCHFEIMDVVTAHPELADYCDFSCFEGLNWACLLRERPEFADRCEWEKFTGEDWNCLYRDNAELALKYEEKNRDWGQMRGSDWSVLLRKRPHLAKRCDWWKLDGRDLWNLLLVQPDLAVSVDQSAWMHMSGADWVDLLTERPEMWSFCTDWWKLNGECWAVLLEYCPWFADRCDWFKLTENDWRGLLKTQPGFIEKCSLEFMDQFTMDSLVKFHKNIIESTDGGNLSADGMTKEDMVKEFAEAIESFDCELADVDGEYSGGDDDPRFTFNVVMKGRNHLLYVSVDLELYEDSTNVAGVSSVEIRDISAIPYGEDYRAGPEIDDLAEIKFALDALPDKLAFREDSFEDTGDGSFIWLEHCPDD